MKSTFSPEYEHFRKCIIEARKEAKLTQAKLGEILGKHQSYIAKYEKGERRLDVIEFLFIAKALNADPFTLLKKIAGGLAD